MAKVKDIVMGEPMPDKNDERYKERYEREKAAGAKFASKVGIGRIAGQLQLYGQSNKKMFLAIVFGFVLTLFMFNLGHLYQSYQASIKTGQTTAVEKLDSVMNERNVIKSVIKNR